MTIIQDIQSAYEQKMITTPEKKKLTSDYFCKMMAPGNEDKHVVSNVAGTYRGLVNSARQEQIAEQQNKQKVKAFSSKLPYNIFVTFVEDTGGKTYPRITGIHPEVFII